MANPDLLRFLLCMPALLWLQSVAARELPWVLMREDEAQHLEAFGAPGVIFHERLCDPPQTSMNKLCTQLPLDYNQPFTQFPVALQFFDPSRPETLPAERLANRRGNSGDDLTMPNFFLLGGSHARVINNERGETEYLNLPLEEIPVVKAGDQYNSSLAIARQMYGGTLVLQQRMVVPQGTVIFRPHRNISGLTWRKCTGEVAPIVPAHTVGKLPNSHRYRSGGDCGARYVVSLWGERSKRDMTSYIFRHSLNFNSGARYRIVSQTWRIGPNDPPGFYTVEWWYAGKLLTRTRFEVKA